MNNVSISKVSGAAPPRPGSSFAHFGFDEQLMHQIRKSEYTQPTPIQCQVRIVTGANRIHRKVLSAYEDVFNASFQTVTKKKMFSFSRKRALGVLNFFSKSLRGPHSSSGDELHALSLRMVTEGIGSENSVFSILTAGQEAFVAR